MSPFSRKGFTGPGRSTPQGPRAGSVGTSGQGRTGPSRRPDAPRVGWGLGRTSLGHPGALDRHEVGVPRVPLGGQDLGAKPPVTPTHQHHPQPCLYRAPATTHARGSWSGTLVLRKGHHGEPLGTASRCSLGPGACWARRTSPAAAFAEGAMFHHVLLILCVRLGREAPQEPGEAGVTWDRCLGERESPSPLCAKRT